jgi:hypothetical protein
LSQLVEKGSHEVPRSVALDEEQRRHGLNDRAADQRDGIGGDVGVERHSGYHRCRDHREAKCGVHEAEDEGDLRLVEPLLVVTLELLFGLLVDTSSDARDLVEGATDQRR